MQNREPTINAPGFTNDELYEWMNEKVKASARLKAALAERNLIQQTLDDLDKQILVLTSSAALAFGETALDPTHHPQETGKRF